MKMKSFAMFAMTGLLAASCVYIAPAMADDMNNGGQPTQAAPSDQASVPSDMQNGGAMSQGSDNTGGNNNSGSNNNTDQASPDTATGDDDY
jgi:hypothetical protein